MACAGSTLPAPREVVAEAVRGGTVCAFGRPSVGVEPGLGVPASGAVWAVCRWRAGDAQTVVLVPQLAMSGWRRWTEDALDRLRLVSLTDDMLMRARNIALRDEC